MAVKKIEQLLKETKISEVVNPVLLQTPPETTVKEAVKLMQENRAGYVVAAKKKKVIGVFSERDLAQKVLASGASLDKKIEEFLDPGAKVLFMSDSVGTAIDTMGRERLYYIPLVDEKGDLVNLISVRTLIRFLAAFYPAEIYNLPPKPGQISTSPEGG